MYSLGKLPTLLLTTFYHEDTVSSCIKPCYKCIVLEKMPMAEEISFGEMLRLERKRLGWSQEELADKLGDKAFSNNDSGDPVTRQTIIRWERGSNFPFPHNLKNLVIVLELDQKGIDAFLRAAGQAPQLPQIIDNLPFKQNPFFTGRETELEQLREQLQVTGTAAITQPISISGLGGIGKTELALEYAHRYYPDVYRTVLWVDAANEDMLQASYANLAEILKLPERNEQKLERRIQAVKDWQKMHSNWLLIMDNDDDLPLAESFLPAKPLGHVVFTTRLQAIGTIPKQIEIDEMGQQEGLLLLLRRSKVLKGEAKLDTVASDIREPAAKLVELLGGHPLALDQAGAYIDETRVSFTDYEQRYHAERHQLLNRRRSVVSKYSEHPESVAKTFKLSFESVCERHPLASDILNFCAFLHPDAMPEELFRHDDSFKYGTTVFDDAIASLHSYSLIKRNTQEQTFTIHRLVQAVLIDAMSPDLQKQWRVRVVRALDASLPAVGLKERERWGLMLPHAMVCATWTKDELDPIVEVEVLSLTARCLYILAVHFFDLGMGKLAGPLLVRSLTIQDEVLKVEHPAYVLNLYTSCIFYLSTLYSRQGKYEQVESLYERELATYEKLFGVEHPNIVVSLDKLARCYRSLRKYVQAELLFRRELTILESHPEEAEFLGVTQPLVWLAYLMQDQGRHEQAEVFYQRALSIEEKQFGPKGLLTQAIRRNYANLLHSIGRDAEAAALEVNDEPSL
jgi:transcriptional regulator with XRE-family HTH domain